MHKVKYMKRALYLSLFCFVIYSCKKSGAQTAAPYQNLAVINGSNPCQSPCIIDCPCSCGNLYFHFTDTAFTDNIPIDNKEIFKFPANITYPVHVKVNWINTTRCGGFAIKITSYEI